MKFVVLFDSFCAFVESFGAFGGRVGSQCRVGWVRSGPRGDL